MTNRKINIRITEENDSVLQLIKKETHNDSDTDAIRYALTIAFEFLASQGKTPVHPGEAILPKNFSAPAAFDTTDENPYLLVSKGWNHELGEHTKLIKQNLKPWLSRELLESDPEFPLYTIIGKPAQGDTDDVQTI